MTTPAELLRRFGIDTSNITGKIVGGVGAVGVAATAAIAYANKRPFTPKITPGDLVFPKDLDAYGISMVFEVMEYQRRSIFSQPYLKPLGLIRLPVARNITDQYRSTWEAEKAEPIVGAAIENILGAKQGGNYQGEDYQRIQDQIARGDLTGVIGTVVDTAGGIAAGTAQQLSRNLISGATMDQLLQPFGLVQNPFLTVLFKQPNFKEFTFNWKLIPRDPNEARTINAIINSFKYYMLPDIAKRSGGTLLNYPNMFQIGFFKSDGYLFRFKPCVIRDMRINYAPASTPSFFKGSQNVPTEIDLSLSVLEIEYWTKEDFSRLGPDGTYIPGVI